MIAILTFCVGGDYKRAMEPGLESKRQYAKKHGYALHIGGEDVWDRTRPIPWSKIRFLLKYLDEYDYIFMSDADVIIMNQEITLETLITRLPPNKDILWTLDACEHYNNGNMLIRGKTPWVNDFFQRVYLQTELIHHIWWDNAGMIQVYNKNPDDAKHIETVKEHWLFNAYVFDKHNSAVSSARLYKPGDFLIHFAGVYDIWNIYRMMNYMRQGNHDPIVLDDWRKHPPNGKTGADTSFIEIIQ